MAVDKLVDSSQLDNNLTSVANAIRTKSGGSSPLVFPSGFVSEIENIPTGSSVEVDSLSVTQNGTYTAQSGHAYSPVTVNVPSSGGSASKKDVNFYDYDGTLLHSYTVAEALDLTVLPENPSHSGLMAQGWNWSLADIKSQVQSTGKCNVGQMYITDDGKTRIYVHFEEGRSSPYFGIGVNGTVKVDWGDGSSISTLTGTSLTTVKTEQHIYVPGDYVIKLTVVSGSFTFFGVTGMPYILTKSTSTSGTISRVYTNAIQKIELGSSVTSIGSNAFSNCFSLASITIPMDITSIAGNAFSACYSLVSITIPRDVTSIAGTTFSACYSLTSIMIPSSVTSIGSSAFQNCYNLASIIIPSSVTSIGASMFTKCYSLASIIIPIGVTSIGATAFSDCYSLASITIPGSVRSIATTAFANCYGMAEYHFLPTTPPTLANKNAFSNIQSDCIIYVPQGCLEAYQTATNWSNYASHIQEEAA